MTEPSQMIACPACDVIYRITPELAESPTVCRRCGHRLTYGKSAALARVVGLSLTSAILMGLVMMLPFLRLHAGQFGNTASVFDAVMGFSTGIMVPLSIAVLGFIVVLPSTRFLCLAYALGPVALGYQAWPGATFALRWGFALKPWAMAEIFMIGVAVALVKLAGMATITMGPAFWAFAGVVVVAAYQETYMCRHTLWTELSQSRS